jgi:hypothetical protein
MKIKASLMATAASMAFVASSSAQVIIDITGSTAGRSTIDATIKSALTGETVAWYNVSSTKNTTSSSSCDGAIYKGGTLLIGGVATPVTVRTFWAGSASGVNYVSNQVQLDNKLLATSVTAAGAELEGVNIVLAPASADTVSEFGFSDVKQAATAYQSTLLSEVGEEESVYVIPFRFVASKDCTFTNITNQQAVSHFTKGGTTKLGLFSGGTETTLVYAMGRDNDSGTRITAFAETGAGVFTQSSQYTGTVTGGVLGSMVNVGDGGYASGGDLASRLAGSGVLAVGYLGLSDAGTAITAGAKSLTYNGVAFSNAAVQNGTYTFWSYYQQIRNELPEGPALSLYETVKAALIALPSGSSSVKLTDMKVERQADGATVTLK